MHVYDPFKSTVTTYASTAIPMERERGEAKTLSFATFALHTRLCAAAHEHVSYHVVVCTMWSCVSRRRKLQFRDS